MDLTHNGCRFFLTVVDDFTKMTWVFLVKYKSDVVNIFYSFVHYVENQFQTVIHCVRTYNAPELTEGELKKLFQLKGILQQQTCVYTSQQNGVVERKHIYIGYCQSLVYSIQASCYFLG